MTRGQRVGVVAPQHPFLSCEYSAVLRFCSVESSSVGL
jgi:hypothetical protein